MNDIITLGREQAMKRLEQYLETLNLGTDCITITGDSVFVHFPTEFKCTPENVLDIKNIFFWNLEVPFSAGLVHFTLSTNTLHLHLMYYDVATKVYEKLSSFGAKIVKFDFSSTSFTFSYTLGQGKVALNYEELEAIRNIANPARNRDHSVHQMIMHSVADLFVHPDTP